MTPQEILEAIAALSEAERRDLLSRLREIYEAPPRAQPLGLGLGQWEGPADFVIVFDGGSQGNPGPGYGSYAIAPANAPGQITRLTFAEPMTNNEAEYRTLLAALRDLLGRLGAQAGESTLEVRGDSQLVIEQVSGNWKARDERMRALRDEARRLLNQFKNRRLVSQPRADTVRVLGH
jgi:probable phosphoglycerate mutase